MNKQQVFCFLFSFRYPKTRPNHELFQKSALRANQWSIHLLRLITHEAMHISASTCLGSVEKGKHLSLGSFSLSSLPLKTEPTWELWGGAGGREGGCGESMLH